MKLACLTAQNAPKWISIEVMADLLPPTTGIEEVAEGIHLPTAVMLLFAHCHVVYLSRFI